MIRNPEAGDRNETQTAPFKDLSDTDKAECFNQICHLWNSQILAFDIDKHENNKKAFKELRVVAHMMSAAMNYISGEKSNVGFTRFVRVLGEFNDEGYFDSTNRHYDELKKYLPPFGPSSHNVLIMKLCTTLSEAYLSKKRFTPLGGALHLLNPRLKLCFVQVPEIDIDNGKINELFETVTNNIPNWLSMDDEPMHSFRRKVRALANLYTLEYLYGPGKNTNCEQNMLFYHRLSSQIDDKRRAKSASTRNFDTYDEGD